MNQDNPHVPDPSQLMRNWQTRMESVLRQFAKLAKEWDHPTLEVCGMLNTHGGPCVQVAKRDGRNFPNGPLLLSMPAEEAFILLQETGDADSSLG